MKHLKSVAFYTLGCKLNFSESSSIARLFEEEGFAKVDFYDRPDVVVINTCSVTDQADKKCRQIVKQAKNISPHAFIAVIGCYAQLKPSEISNIPGVNLVLGAQEKFNLPQHILNYKEDSEKVLASEIKDVKDFIPSYSYGDRTRSFLKVQDGCDYFCSFCTIPLARGRSRSNSIEQTLKVAREVANTKVKEVVLTGVNLGDFGKANDENFYELIQELEKLDGIERYRISSIEPNLLSNEIIDFVSNSKKFVPHFHIPLQSGSDKILKSMRRRYDSQLYVDRVEKIKKLMPHCCIGVDVITGYPGENEKEFLKTYQFLNELDVSYLHVFTYSERNNTVAVRKTDEVVPMDVRRKRSKMLQILSEKKKRHFYEQELGKKHKVLFESQESGGYMYGFTENYLKVRASYNPEWINEVKNIHLSMFHADGSLGGEVLVEEFISN